MKRLLFGLVGLLLVPLASLAVVATPLVVEAPLGLVPAPLLLLMAGQGRHVVLRASPRRSLLPLAAVAAVWRSASPLHR